MEPKENKAQEEQKDGMKDPETQPESQSIEEKYKELSDKFTRLYAEYDNFRRRTAKEKIDWVKSAGEEIILKVLPVLDDIERAIAHNKEITDPAILKEGLELIGQKFKTILTSRGVEPMESAGKPFDPELHDAITSIAAPSEDMKGKVVDEVEKGYTQNGKVIRHAKVVVGN
jgi:molecular chaperone GrpE